MAGRFEILRKKWKRLVAWTSLLAILWLLSSLLVAYQATRRPHGRHLEPVPLVVWGDLQSLRLATADGEDLGGWFSEGQPDQPVVLLLHGHRGSRGNCLGQAQIFATAGCGVLLVTLRAHGDSTGDFNDVGYSSRHDVLAAISWLEVKCSGRPIVIYGQSMGAATATFASALLGNRVHGYILESPYLDLRTAVRNRTAMYLPPLLDALAYAGLVAVSPLVLPDVDHIAPITAVSGMPATMPVLVLAGGADQHARPEEARAITECLGASARLVIFQDAEHGRLPTVDPTGYRDALIDFLASCRLAK